MKKPTALISALALLLTLCACSGDAAGGANRESAAPGPGTASQAVSEAPTTPDIPPSEEPEPSDAPAEETGLSAPSEEIQLSDAPSETSAPTPTPEPAATREPAATPEPTPAPTPEPTPAADLKAIAVSLINHPVSELYAAIGRPISSDYAPGCVEPDSEDGELIYSGFIVYTVRTASREYVYDVL